MAINLRRGGVFVGGVVLGGVLAAALVGQSRDDDAPAVTAPPTTAGLQQTATTTAARRVDCAFAPIVAPAGKEDGLLPLDKDLQGNSPSAVATLILTGKEAAAAGKPRDAETAFLMACRSAESVRNDPIPLADSQYQLGRHYAQVAAPPDAPKRAELLRRAESLYASSLQVYKKHRGDSHEKTRFALKGLEDLQQLTGTPASAVIAATPAAEESARAAQSTRIAGNAPQPPAAPPVAAAPAKPPAVVAAPPVVTPPVVTPPPVAAAKPPAPAPATPPVAEAKPAPRQEPAPVAVAPAAAPEPAPQPQRQARRSSPSFDCSKARSTTEKLICDDEDLARQDRELGRIHSRAKQAAADPRAFQRESDAEWAQREATCTDRECLQRWYAKRRAELAAAAQRTAAPAPERSATTERRPAPAPVVRTAPPSEPSTRASGAPPAPREPVAVDPVPRRAIVAPAPREPAGPSAPTREVEISQPPATASGSAGTPAPEE